MWAAPCCSVHALFMLVGWQGRALIYIYCASSPLCCHLDYRIVVLSGHVALLCTAVLQFANVLALHCVIIEIFRCYLLLYVGGR